MTPLLLTVTGWLANRLVTGSLQAVVLVALVWLACCRPVRLSAAMQATLWWVALLRIVLVLAPVPSVAIPVLPAVPVPTPMSVPLRVSDAAEAGRLRVFQTPPDDAGEHWFAIVVGLWLAGAGLHAALVLRGVRTMRAIVRRSQPSAADDEVVAHLAARIGLASVPEVRTSPEVAAPQVVGLRRPVVLMPTEADLSPQDRLMALGHEVMHVKRRDLALGWIPAAAERLFFFHPLVRLAAREYLTAREAACDAAVVRALDVSPGDYGRLLVRFSVTGQRPVWAAGTAASSLGSLRRRLDMLQRLSEGSRRAAWLAGAAAVMAIVPAHLVARTTPAPPKAEAPAAFADAARVKRLPDQVSAAPPQQVLTEPRPAEPHAQVAQERPRTQDFIREQFEEMARQMRDVHVLNEKLGQLQAAQTPDVDRIAQDAQRRVAIETLLGQMRAAQSPDVDRISQDAQTRVAIEELLEQMRQQSERIRAQAQDQTSLDALAEAMRMKAREFQRQLEEQLRSQAAQERSFNQSLSDQPAARQEVLRQRIQELSKRIEMLVEQQRQLQMEAEQLKRELDGVK